MEYEIIRKPFIFLETIEMLYKHVNGISFHALLRLRQVSSHSSADDKVPQRMMLLQEIMEEVCRDIDAGDPMLRKYFACLDSGLRQDSPCLARVLVGCFIDVKSPDFDQSVADIYANWNYMQECGAWIKGHSGVSLTYTKDPGCPGDLFTQICSLEFPAEFLMRLYDAMRNFPETLKELVDLIRPVAMRLTVALERAQPILDEVADYWLDAPVPPLDFLADTAGPKAVLGAGERLRLAVSLMGSNFILHGMEHASVRCCDYSYMIIGCCITTSSMLLRDDSTLDEASVTLKAIGDRKRLEILRRLAKKRFYGLELAEIMNMDPGNLSRSLTALYNHGFLRQERENLRTYYQADREAFQHFLDHLMAVIFD